MDGAAPPAAAGPRGHVPRPTWTARRSFAHAEIGPDAVAHIDRILRFHGLDPERIRTDYLDTCRRPDLCRLSWVSRRSAYPAAQNWRHELVRFALDDLVIRTGKTVLIESPFDDPVELIVYRLAIEPGGVLRIEAPCTLTVGQLLGLPTSSANRDYPLPLIEARAPAGQAGAVGAAGASGADGTRDAPNGLMGSAGGAGQPGTVGLPLPEQHVSIHTLVGELEFTAQAGGGGGGGAGGRGGQGGRGHSVAFFDMGVGGLGGPGGPGGDGGAGGRGAPVQLGIRIRDGGSALHLRLAPASGGPGGAGGGPGPGGIGAPDGRSGDAGVVGRSGAPGTPVSLVWTEGESGHA